MVLDTHTHCWGPPSEEHPWVNSLLVGGEGKYTEGTFFDDYSVDLIYTADKLIHDMDRVGIEEAVVVDYPVGKWNDNYWTVKAAAEHDRLSGVVLIDPFAEDSGDIVREYMNKEGIIGYRLGAFCPRDAMWEELDDQITWLLDAIDEDQFWEATAETNAAVHVMTLPNQLYQAVELVEEHPELTYLIDHFSYIRADVQPPESPFEHFEELAQYDNVAVKISGVVTLSNTEYPYVDKHDHVNWLLDKFGRERVVWGSDFPNESHESQYIDTLSWLNHVEGLSDKDRKWITENSFKSHIGF